MNKRIRKKKAKQQLIRAISGLVEAAEEMQREQERRTRQAGISYIKYIEAVRERQYGITRYDKAAQKSIPYSYTLSWNVYTNSPHGYGQAKIAGQDRKVFADRAAMEKYLNGRIKAYEELFTEISPAIPPEYAEQFRVNGQLLPGYTVEGEEIKQPAADSPAAAPRTEPGQETEQFAILIDSRTRFETGEPGGYWLSMPATKEQLHEAMQSVGITADNPQEFFIHGYDYVENAGKVSALLSANNIIMCLSASGS